MPSLCVNFFALAMPRESIWEGGGAEVGAVGLYLQKLIEDIHGTGKGMGALGVVAVSDSGHS